LKSTSETVKIVQKNNIPQHLSNQNKESTYSDQETESNSNTKASYKYSNLDENKPRINQELIENEMVEYNQLNNGSNKSIQDEKTKIKITGYSTTNLLDKNKNLSKNLQTLEIKKESKLASNDLNASNIEVSGRDPSTNSNIRLLDSASISSRENLNDTQSSIASSVSESDSQYKLKILKVNYENLLIFFYLTNFSEFYYKIDYERNVRT
jgi:hypothetical protein